MQTWKAEATDLQKIWARILRLDCQLSPVLALGPSRDLFLGLAPGLDREVVRVVQSPVLALFLDPDLAHVLTLDLAADLVQEADPENAGQFLLLQIEAAGKAQVYRKMMEKSNLSQHGNQNLMVISRKFGEVNGEQ